MLKLKRKELWMSAFAEEVDRQRHNPFVWGENDCWTGLLVGIVKALTGHTIKENQGSYSNEQEAYEGLKASGFDNLGDAVATLLPEIHPSQADVGDVGFVPADNLLGGVLCIFDVGHLIVMTDEEAGSGHGRLRRSRATRAFKIG